jgi:propanol-preferring alcohol dehydrogenase
LFFRQVSSASAEVWRSDALQPLQLIGASGTVVGHAAGASIDLQDTLAFSTLSGVRPMIETMPLARAAEAYARMMRGDAHFRMVLTME